jgi:hypothetical protein
VTGHWQGDWLDRELIYIWGIIAGLVFGMIIWDRPNNSANSDKEETREGGNGK